MTWRDVASSPHLVTADLLCPDLSCTRQVPLYGGEAIVYPTLSQRLEQPRYGNLDTYDNRRRAAAAAAAAVTVIASPHKCGDD